MLDTTDELDLSQPSGREKAREREVLGILRLARRNSQGDEASTEVLFCRICGEQAENMEYLQVMVEPCHLMLTEFLQMHHNIFHGSNGNYQHLGALAQEPVEVNEIQQQPQEKVKKSSLA